MHCQVASDTARHYTDLDKQAEYEAAIEMRADAIVENLDDLEDLLLTKFERDRLMLNLRALISGTPSSRAKAADEVRSLILDGARRRAEHNFAEEMAAAAERIAHERWENRVSAWA